MEIKRIRAAAAAVIMCMMLMLGACGGDTEDPGHSGEKADSKASQAQGANTRAKIEERMREAGENNPDAIPYDQAREHIGEYVTLYGIAAEVEKLEDDNEIYIDIGNPYPSRERVTGVIWPKHHSEFPDIEDMKGKMVYIEGTVYDYEGIPNIDLEEEEQLVSAE